MTIVDQLVDIYFNHEWWHKNRMSESEARKYHQRLLDKERIIYYHELGTVVGYVESWRISYEQFGRLICHEPFSAETEDVNTGNICYVANTWIRRDRRNTDVYKLLKLAYFRQNFMCDYFVGSALRKKTQPIKVFKKSALMSKVFKTGESHGKQQTTIK